MNPNQITGKVLVIYPSRPYTKRDGQGGWSQTFVLETTNNNYSEYPSFDISESIDGNCIQHIVVGKEVTVKFYTSGRKYTKANGEEAYINTNKCISVLPSGQDQPQRTTAQPALASVSTQSSPETFESDVKQFMAQQQQVQQTQFPFPNN